jgi:hypothetical protein
MQALKARDSRAQGKAAKQPQPWVLKRREVSPERAAQSTCFALSGLCFLHSLPQGSGAARLHPSLLRAFSALDT